ncbi:Chymotrypsinogen B [Linderina pennispora]|nr:Chymotrypsinogen B [Linderina pennispora]
MCGSTIISKNFVVTAGHCIVDDVTNQINTPENIYIGYGSSEYKKQTLVQATKLFLHPQYDISRFKNDIAIIQVPDLPVDGVNASTVPLYKGGLYPGMETTAIGWGLTNYTNITSQSPGIKEAVVRIGNTKLCKSHVKKYLNTTARTNLGNYTNASGNSIGLQTIVNALSFIKHPNFDMATLESNASFIKVSKMMLGGSSAAAAELYSGLFSSGDSATAIGWGTTDDSEPTATS